MRLHNFGYLVKEGARSVVRNKLMSFACIGVLVACMLLIGGAAMLSLNVTAMVGFVEEQNEVSIFLEDWLTPSDLEMMELELGSMGNIARSTFVSKEEALEELMLQDPVMFGGLEEDNPMPNKFIVQIDDLARIEDTVAKLREIAYSGAVIVAILLVVSVVIITNNIKLTIYSRRREINIMKYVGATDTFIRMPFLVEGVLIGLLSAIMAFLILGFGYTYLIAWIGEKFSAFLGPIFGRAIDFWSIAHYIFGAFATMGVFIGAVGSGIFVRKHLRV